MRLFQGRPPLRALIQASTAGRARVLRSAAIAIVSSARAVITRPPEVACAGAKRLSSAGMGVIAEVGHEVGDEGVAERRSLLRGARIENPLPQVPRTTRPPPRQPTP